MTTASPGSTRDAHFYSFRLNVAAPGLLVPPRTRMRKEEEELNSFTPFGLTSVARELVGWR